MSCLNEGWMKDVSDPNHNFKYNQHLNIGLTGNLKMPLLEITFCNIIT